MSLVIAIVKKYPEMENDIPHAANVNWYTTIVHIQHAAIEYPIG